LIRKTEAVRIANLEKDNLSEIDDVKDAIGGIIQKLKD
jgi:hypothetical protein